MQFLETGINPLGMGCWPIGGAMFHGETSLGYCYADDDEAIRAIHAALDGGIGLFDTAAAYGAGHSERLLAKALKGRGEPLVVTKIGIGIDEAAKQLSFDAPCGRDVLPAIEGCLRRLERDRIDLLLLHVNEMATDEATAIFDEMERACEAGLVRAYGWSTDFSAGVAAFAERARFAAVEHAMNVFVDAPRMQAEVQGGGMVALLRSPLAMGVLTGKYGADTVLPAQDIRASGQPWMEYFIDGRINPSYLEKLNAVRDLLCADGRSIVQGALGWLWAKGRLNIPIPGARTVAQIEGIAGALAHGPLPAGVMMEIEGLIERKPEDAQDRSR